MSRTYNTRPFQPQEQAENRSARDEDSSHAGVGQEAKFQEHQARQRVRMTLARGDEPAPTRHRHHARYDH
jgi:hypothetical protein